jgi:hypothetical protein
MKITLDRQTVAKECSDCCVSFSVVRGSVYDAGQPVGIYLIALHGHSPDGRIAHAAVALLDRTAGEPHPVAAAILVTEMPQQFECQFVPWSESPFRDDTYLGEMLEPDVARQYPRRDLMFAIVDCMLDDLPEVQSYFSGRAYFPGQ